jgi:hypothetical protein
MNARRLLLIATVAAPLWLGGCASHSITDHAGQQPVLDLARYFNGEVLAHGMFQDRAGRVVKRFTVQITGTWQGDQGTLDERFVYADGSTQRRVWHLTRGADGRYTGRADDVVGDATGQAVGNALNWRYTLRLPVDGSVYEVQFDDWMILVDERVLLNRATMSKWGVTLGEVTLSFTRQP